MQIYNNLYIYLALIISGAAVYFDFKYRKIPNWLTLTPLALLLIYLILFGSRQEIFDHFLAGISAGSVWYIFWRLNFVGGGDQKLVMLLGVCLGLNLVFYFMFAVVLCGGAQSFFGMLINNQYKINNLWKQRKIGVPYSVSIYFGLVITLIIGLNI